MLQQANTDNKVLSERPNQHRLGILNSPVFARLERAMIRHEESKNRQEDKALRSQYTQSLLTNSGQDSSNHVIKRGLLLQQRDRFFSRWKGRYFILTHDYLQCFRRATGHARISEMGQFLFKIKLNEVAMVEWENKKTYSTIALALGRDGKIYLRSADGLEDWFELLEECILTSKERRNALRYSHEKSTFQNNNEPNNTLHQFIDNSRIMRIEQVPPVNNTAPMEEFFRRRIKSAREQTWESSFNNRLSDIDINIYEENSNIETPSITSYRMSDDIFCIQPLSLRGIGSFRSNIGLDSSTIRRKQKLGGISKAQF